ncbi:MAG: VPLPA-CTERM sorting domain-containing protein [Acetobacteraceae bacterium]
MTMIAVIVVMLFGVTPCGAATIAIDQIDLNYADGFKVVGSIGFTPIQPFGPDGGTLFLPSPDLTVSLNGDPLVRWFSSSPGHGNIPGLPLLYATSPYSFGPVAHLTWPVQPIPVGPEEFLLNGRAPISGTVTCTGDCAGLTPPEVSPTPIPAALPLLGSGLAALAALSRRRSKFRQS